MSNVYSEHIIRIGKFLMLICIFAFCMSGKIVFSGVSMPSEQPMQELFKGKRERFEMLYTELQNLEKIHRTDMTIIVKKKVELYNVMIALLKQKRELFQAKIDTLQAYYSKLKEDKRSMETLEAIYQKIITLSDNVDKTSQQINQYTQRKEDIIRKQIQKNIVIPTEEEIKARRWLLIEEYKRLLARHRNLRRAGANPNDLVHLAREIDIIHNKILAIDHTLQRAEDETAAELERIQDEINKAWDEESEQRKRTTVDYRYRRIERIEDRGVDLRFYDDYISEIPYANKLPGRKNDQRAEHYRADKRQPGKRITKVDYEVKQ